MPNFFFNLHRKTESGPLIASCSITGGSHGFENHVREFSNEKEAAKALVDAGIDRDRYEGIIDGVKVNEARSFEISVCEAQKLDILRIDSTE
jgi:hypothetical protein